MPVLSTRKRTGDVQCGEEKGRPRAVLGERGWKGHRAVVCVKEQ